MNAPETIDISLPTMPYDQWQQGGGATGQPTADMDTEQPRDNLSPRMHWLLDKIATTESNGQYDVRYGGKDGPQHFTDYSAHPNIPSDIPGTGHYSTAAGRYQFLKSTWDNTADKLNLTDFGPVSQDRAAAYLATETYKKATGRDLETDAGDPSKAAAIEQALRPQWPSIDLGGNTAMAKTAPPPRPTPTSPAMSASVTAAPPTTANNDMLTKLMTLSMINNLNQSQKQTPITYDAANPTSWANALLQSGQQQQSPLQNLTSILALKALLSGQGQTNPLLYRSVGQNHPAQSGTSSLANTNGIPIYPAGPDGRPVIPLGPDGRPMPSPLNPDNLS